jgi:hypothetical protein
MTVLSPVEPDYLKLPPFFDGRRTESELLLSLFYPTAQSLMPERRRRPQLEPRWLTIGEAAQYLGHSPSWLSPERLKSLQETGFPRLDPILDRIDREAIDNWSDRRNGVIPETASVAIASAAPVPSKCVEGIDPWIKAARTRG